MMRRWWRWRHHKKHLHALARVCVAAHAHAGAANAKVRANAASPHLVAAKTVYAPFLATIGLVAAGA